LNDNLQVSLLT